ncbi:hypothetical protein ACPA9J_27450 [Pseudomonas aeruginosa]
MPIRRGKTRSLHPSRHPAGQQPDLLEAGGLRRVLCASPEYLLKHGLPRTPEELERHTCLQHNGCSNASIELAVQQRRHYQANQDLAGQPPVREQCRAPGGRSLARLGGSFMRRPGWSTKSGQRQAR